MREPWRHRQGILRRSGSGASYQPPTCGRFLPRLGPHSECGPLFSSSAASAGISQQLRSFPQGVLRDKTAESCEVPASSGFEPKERPRWGASWVKGNQGTKKAPLNRKRVSVQVVPLEPAHVECSAVLAPTSVPQRGFRVLERFGFHIKEANGTRSASSLIFHPPFRFSPCARCAGASRFLHEPSRNNRVYPIVTGPC